MSAAGRVCACAWADGGGDIFHGPQSGEHGPGQAEAGFLSCGLLEGVLSRGVHDWCAKAAQYGDLGQVLFKFHCSKQELRRESNQVLAETSLDSGFAVPTVIAIQRRFVNRSSDLSRLNKL